MEEVFLRFPHLIEKVFYKLNNESLVTCRKVSKTWCDQLDGQKFPQVRKIKAKVKQFHAIGDAWKIFFKKASLETVIDFGKAVDKFYQINPSLFYDDGMASSKC